MKRRIYRLGALLEHAGACDEFKAFVARFKTADEVLAAINADPGWLYDPEEPRNGTAVWAVRWFAYDRLAWRFRWSDAEEEGEYRWWRQRAGFGDGAKAEIASTDTRPITPEERLRFLMLWKRYADRFGLYEEVEDA